MSPLRCTDNYLVINKDECIYQLMERPGILTSFSKKKLEPRGDGTGIYEKPRGGRKHLTLRSLHGQFLMISMRLYIGMKTKGKLRSQAPSVVSKTASALHSKCIRPYYKKSNTCTFSVRNIREFRSRFYSSLEGSTYIWNIFIYTRIKII